MNQLTTELAEVCRKHLLEEKWLIAPARRAGHQWLATVVRSGQAVVNCHVKTISSIAIDLAGPAMASAGVELVSAVRGALLIDRIIQRHRDPPTGYLGQLSPSTGLAETLYAAIDDLRRAGLGAGQMAPRHFEVGRKGQEIAMLLEEYLEELRGRHWIDRAELLRLAIDRLRGDSEALANNVLVLLPVDIESKGLERELIEALPPYRLMRLSVDQPQVAPANEPMTNAMRLRWLTAPTSAPPPIADDSAAIFRAIGEINEVREVLRRCLAAGRPLDEIEVLTTDLDTYVPLLYDTFAGLLSPEENLDEMPVTFQEGIPSSRFRPGRALIAWVNWIRDDYPQHALVQMIQEGLLAIEDADRESFGFNRLATILRKIGIGFGRERYLARIDAQMNGLEEQVANRTESLAEDDEADNQRVTALCNLLAGVRLLRALVKRLLDVTPAPNASPLYILDAASGFLQECARSAGKLDNFAREKLVREIDDLRGCLGEEKTSLNVWDWLPALAQEAWVGGSGPRGGHLHVAHVLAGGHSGRPCTFIVGLDDGRFPGAGLPDPILLDSERRRLSPELPTAQGRLQDRLERFALVIARLRSRVTLSYSCRDLADDREMFPSPVVLAAFRVLSGKHEGDHASLLEAVPLPASFAPDAPDKALDESEWWLWRLSGPEKVAAPKSLVGSRFAHLGKGYLAAEERASKRFTIFDGRLSGHGVDIDPTAAEGPVMSASRLELLGRCPLAYFFRHVLGIQSPEETEIDPDAWLDPMSRGLIVHRIFERFLSELIAQDRAPDYGRDERRLMQILDEMVERERRLKPPPSEGVFVREYRNLQLMARIFLREDDEFCRRHDSRPVFVETSIGMPPASEPGRLDSAEPVSIRLSDGRGIRVRGRIDRIDRMGDGAFAVWDYKTGSSFKFQRKPPFNQGRVIQHALYLEMMNGRLEPFKTQLPESRVEYIGYFFVSERSRGERIQFAPHQLADGHDILEKLIAIASSGGFPATNDNEDCTYCDYRGICGDTRKVTAASGQKLTANSILQPFLELRTGDNA